MRKKTVLVVDDDRGHRLMLEALLQRWGFAVSCAGDGAAAVQAVSGSPFDAVLMDIRMAGMDGITALKGIKEHNPAVPVIIMTAFSAVDSAVAALKAGALDYLVKPLDFDVLKATLGKALEHCAEAIPPGEPPAPSSRFNEALHGIVGNSPAIRALQQLIRTVAPSAANVLITGKSGTGKELVARALHEGSQRSTGPLVAVNCAALSETLLESELFGHERGAFTGADRQRSGCFAQAHGGTLFLDEIGEIPTAMQARLLRAIQQKEIQRVGSDVPVSVDVRIIAATNRDLPTEVAAGRFREDLYYRLNVVHVHLPDLRERGEDIPLLAQHFLQIHAQRNRKEVKGFTPQAMNALVHYDWPGNVRQLENTVERAVVLLVGGYVSERELPDAVLRHKPDAPSPYSPDCPEAPVAGKPLEDVERDAILRTLRETDNNKSEAARQLGISRKTLHMKLKKIQFI